MRFVLLISNIVEEKSMPNCRNCGARLSKFDADLCPVCGIKNPLQGIDSETVEVTSQIDLSDMKEGQKVVRRRKSMILLFFALGFTGAPFFYIKKAILGLVWLLCNLAVIAGLFCLFYFVIHAHIALAIVIPVVVVYAINAIVGAIYNFLPDLKDGEGEFIV